MKKPVTKIVALFLLLALVCFAGMAGCAKTGEDNSSESSEESTAPADETPADEAPAVEPATVRFAEFSAGESNAETLVNMLALFADAYPQIEVVDESTGYGDYFTELTTQIAGGDAPDVFELNFENFSGFVTRDTIEPLDALIASHGTDMSVYQQGLLDNVCTVDGQLMSLPFSYSTVMLIYNMDLFDAAGIPYPTDDWTWEDELAAAQAIANPEEDIWGTYNAMHHIWEFYKRIAQNGGSLFTEDGSAFAINSPQNVETLQWMQDLIWKYHVMPNEEERADRGENELFGSGKLGMFLGGIWTFTDLKERCGDDIRWGVAVEPGNTQKATHVFCNVLCVSNATEVPDAAFTLANFLTSDPGVEQLRLDAQWELPPVSDPAVMEAYVLDTPPENKDKVLESTTYGVMPPVMKDFNMLANDIMAPHLEAVRDNIETPQEALDAAQAEATAQIDLSEQ
jgi:multiple sugar transport system substrate-binding protein